MLGFFPTPYPDELLYSVLARYQIRAGTISRKTAIEEFFNTRTASAVLDLPSQIGTLIKNMPPGSSFVAEDLIYKNTMFPLYEPFLKPEQSKLVFEAMFDTNGSSIHTRAGIMASSIKSLRYLQFCPLCFQDEIRDYGEAYWHRLQQIPGILACHAHQCLLQSSSIPTLKHNKGEFHSANAQVCRIGPTMLSFNSETMDKLITLAGDVTWLLRARIGPYGRTWFYEQYKNLLIEKGFATTNGRVFQGNLHQAFIEHYGEKYLRAVGAMLSVDVSDNWLIRLTRKPHNSFHPLYHLLFIRFLGESVDTFFDRTQSYRPFGLPPWPCLNAAADHYLQLVVDKVYISYCCDTKRPVGTFCCSCGFVFSRRGPDTCPEDRLRIGRIKTFGPVWFARFKELISSDSMSYRAIASDLKVDKDTVIKYSKLIDNIDAFVVNPINESQMNGGILLQTDLVEQSIEENWQRKAWLQTQRENEGFNKTELRRMLPSVYNWLYRHDREWLNGHSPLSRRATPNKKRADWNARDKELLLAAQRVIKELKTRTGKPIRITISRVGKELGKLAWLEKHLDKMPATRAYLESVVQDRDTYNLTKTYWAMKLLESKGEEIKVWKVLKLVGIRKEFVNEKLVNVIVNYNTKNISIATRP